MARDKFHQIVRMALEKDGWEITHDPYPLQLTRRKLGIDLGAEKIIAAVKESEKIAVEIKSFLNDWSILLMKTFSSFANNTT